MTSPHNDPIAPHLAVMERCLVCEGAGRIMHMWDRPGGPPGNGYAPCPACNGGLVDDGRAQALKDFAKAMNEFPAAHLLPTAASEQSTTLDQRRARAQAQPRGEGGRFVVNHERPGQLYAVWEEVRAQDATISAMAGTIRDLRTELTRLRTQRTAPDLIPMPAMKLGIFIGSFVTMLVMTGLAYFTHLI